MALRINTASQTGYEAQLQGRRQLLQAQRLLIKATTQDGASDIASRLDSELGGEVDKLDAELKSAKTQPYSAETMEFLLRPRYDTVDIGLGSI